MTNNERFNQLLNSCQDPQAVYSSLWALVGTGMEWLTDSFSFLIDAPETPSEGE